MLFKLLAELRQFNPRSLPTLCDAAGDPVPDAEAGTKVLEEHFADEICAVEVSSAAKAHSELLDWHRRGAARLQPTMGEISAIIGATRARKAQGRDAIPAETWQICP